MRVSRFVWPGAAVALVALALSGAQGASLAARGAGLALAVASLVVLAGWSGQLNLHVAAVGLGWGAYAAIGLAQAGVPSLAALVVAPLIVVPAALAIGSIAVRFRGLELAIATLAAGLAFEQSIFRALGKWLARDAGGVFESSLVTIARPALFDGDRAYALFAIAIAAAWLGVAASMGRGRPGRALRAIRDREVVAEARGVPVFGWRLAAFVASTAIAAAGGALLAGQTGAVTPDAFGLPLSLQLLAVATLFGIGRLETALAGAAVIVLSQELASVPVLRVFAGDRADLVFGIGLIAGIAWRARPRTVAAPARAEVVAPASRVAFERVSRAAAPTVLRAQDVVVSFGALRVLDGVTLRVGEGEIVGLTGGNGAGKTTLFNCITGLVTPTEGAVFLLGNDVTQMPPHRRAALGLARTFQGVEVFEGLTVAEGLLVSAAMRGGRRGEDALRARVHSALDEIGVGAIADAAPESLPFATLRLVEIATALVADPALVLLDEPLAGLDGGERARVLSAVARLRAQGRAVLIVEHDHASIDAIADRVYELRAGRVTERTLTGGRVAARA